MTNPRACRFCGCTETTACVSADGPCYWVGPTVCSACAVTRNGLTFLPIEDAARDGRAYIVMTGDNPLDRARWSGDQWCYVTPGEGGDFALPIQPTHYHPRAAEPHPD